MTSLTSLKLDHIRQISTRTLMSYIGVLECVEMASKWVGYKPRANVENIISNRELFRLQTAKVTITVVEYIYFCILRYSEFPPRKNVLIGSDDTVYVEEEEGIHDL